MIDFIKDDNNNKIYEFVLYKIKENENKKQIISQDMLGRTLAYTCFLPRLSNIEFLCENFLYKDKPNKAIHVEIEQLAEILQKSKIDNQSNIEDDSISIFINDIKKTQENIIDCISAVRRLMPVFIAYNTAIIDTYQILEIAIAGADMIVFDSIYLKAYIACMFILKENANIIDTMDINTFLNKLYNIKTNHNILQSHEINLESMLQEHVTKLISFTYNIGLIPILHIHTEKDLKLFSLQDTTNCILTKHENFHLLPKDSLIFAYNNHIQANKQKNIDVIIDFL